MCCCRLSCVPHEHDPLTLDLRPDCSTERKLRSQGAVLEVGGVQKVSEEASSPTPQQTNRSDLREQVEVLKP